MNPDFVWNLDEHPLPFEDESFDEIHAYEILEHLGRQGDWRFWCSEWNEYYRILRKNGVFCATCPSENSVWAFGDPGHTRIVSKNWLIFLNQQEYEKQQDTPMTDYREWYKGNFRILHLQDDGEKLAFILEKL